jgi:hypothetical protein
MDQPADTHNYSFAEYMPAARANYEPPPALGEWVDRHDLRPWAVESLSSRPEAERDRRALAEVLHVPGVTEAFAITSGERLGVLVNLDDSGRVVSLLFLWP